MLEIITRNVEILQGLIRILLQITFLRMILYYISNKIDIYNVVIKSKENWCFTDHRKHCTPVTMFSVVTSLHLIPVCSRGLVVKSCIHEIERLRVRGLLEYVS